MAIQSLDISKELESIKGERGWLDKTLRGIKHFFSPAAKQQDQLRDEREATVRAQTKINESSLLADVEDLANTYLREKNEINALETSLSEMEEYDDNFVTTQKLLRAKKDTFENKKNMYYEKLAKYKDVETQNDIIELARNPLTSNFIDRQEADKFVQNIVSTQTPTNLAEETKRSIELSAINSLMKNSSPVVKEMIREGLIDTPDEYYNSIEFLSAAKSAIRAITDTVGSKAELYIDDTGKIDYDLLYEQVKNNADVTSNLNIYEHFMESEKERLKKSKFAKTKGLNRLYGWTVRFADLLSSEGEKTWEMMNTAEGKTKSFGRFGNADVDQFLRDATYTDTVWRKFGRMVADNPQDTLMFVASMWLPIAKGNVYRTLLGKSDDAITAWKAISGMKGADLGVAKMMQGAKWIAKRVPYATREIALSLPVNAVIDSFVSEYDNLGLNTAFDVGVAALIAPKLNNVEKIISSVNNIPSSPGKAKYLKNFFKGSLAEELAEDTTKLRSYLETFEKATAENPEAFAGLRFVQNAVEEAGDQSLDFYRNFFNNTVEGFSKAFGEDFAQYYGDNITNARAALGNDSLSDAQKLDITSSAFKNIVDNTASDDLYKRIAGVKLGETLESAIVATTAKVLESVGVPTGKANAIAFNLALDPNPDLAKITTDILADVDDTKKIEVIKQIYDEIIEPVMKTPKTIQGKIAALKELTGNTTLGQLSDLDNKFAKRIVGLEMDETLSPNAKQGVKETIIADMQKQYGDISRQEATKIYDDLLAYGPRKRNEKVVNFVNKLNSKHAKRLNKVVGDFLEKLPEGAEKTIIEPIADFYDEIDNLTRDGLVRGLTNVALSASQSAFTPGFYNAYEGVVKTFDDVAGVFGENFVEHLRGIEPDFIQAFNEGNKTAAELGMKHTQYLIEKYLFDPDGLMAYATYIRDKSLGTPKQKARLLVQLDLIDSSVIDPTYNLIYGIAVSKRGSRKAVEELFTEIELNSARQVMQDLFGAKTTQVISTGEEITARNKMFEVSAPELEAAFRSLMNNFSSAYKRALATGVATPGDSTYVPRMKDMLYKVRDAILNKEDVDISAAYLNSDGIRFLDAVFQESLQVDGYENFLQQAFKSKQKQFSAIGEVLIRDFYDPTTNTLKAYADITQDGEVIRVSLFDILADIDPRLTDLGTKNSGGIVYSHALSLTKYEVLNNFDAFNLKRKTFLTEYMGANEGNMFFMDDMVGFSKRMGLGDMPMKDIIAESYTNLLADVRNKLKSSIEGAEKLIDEQIVDLMHPLYYSFDEYFTGIARGSEELNVVDSVVARLLDAHQIKAGKDTSVANAIMKGMPDNIKEGFVVAYQGHAQKNLLVTRLSEEYTKFAKTLGENIVLGPESLDNFLYNSIGYFLIKPEVRTNSTTIFDVFGGKIIATLRDMGFKKMTPVTELIGDIRLAINTGKTADIEKAKASIKKLMDNTTWSIIEDDLNQYIDFVKANDARGARSYLVKNVQDFILNNAQKTLKITEGDAPAGRDLLVNSLKKAEERAKFKQNYDVIKDELHSRLLIDKVQNDLVRGNADAKGFAESMTTLLGAMGVSPKQARDMLKEKGLTDEVIDILFSEADVKKISKEKALKATVELIDNNMLSVQTLMKNKTFTAEFNKIQVNYMDSNTSEMMRRDITTWLGGKKIAQAHFLKNGEFTKEVNTAYGRFFDNIFKSIVTINTRGLYDEEVAGMVNDIIDSRNSGKIFDPKILYKGEKVESVSINAYLSHVRDRFTEIVDTYKIRNTDIKEVAKKAWERSDATTPQGFRKQVFTRAEIAEMYDQPGQEGLRELFEFFYGYRQDITSFRSWKTGTEQRVPNAAMLYESKNMNQMISAMTGLWVHLSDRQVHRMIKKYGFNETRNESIWNALLAGFDRDVLYGGLFYTDVIDKTNNLISKGYIAMQYNLLTGFPVGIQQLINNNVSAASLSHAFGPSIGLNDLEKSNFIKDLLGFDLLLGRKADVALGEPGVSAYGVAQRKFNSFIQKTSALYQADALSMDAALKSSLIQGLAPIYDSGGKKLVDHAIQKIKKMNEFTTQYGMDSKKFLNKGYGKTYLKNYAFDNGLDVDKLINEYLTHFRTYQTELKPIMSRTRSALGAFYVTDNIREFGSVRIIDKGKNRFFFALKKWAIGKAGEYAYRIINETGGRTLGEIVNNIGDSKTLQQIGIEMAQFMRMGWLIQKSTGGEYEAEDFMYAMAVPTVVLAMTLTDPLYAGVNRFKDYRKGEQDIFTATVAGALEFINEMSGTAFLYHAWTISKLEQSMDTAASYNDSTEKLGKFFASFMQGLLLRAYGKLSPQYRGMPMNSLYDGSATTDMIEWLTNTDSSLQRDIRKKADTAFMARRIANGGGVGQVIGTAISDYPLIKLGGNFRGLFDKSFDYASNYSTPVLAQSLNEYIEEKNLYLFNKQFLAGEEEKEQLFELINNFEDQRMLARIISEKGPEGQRFVEKVKQGTVTREEMDAMFREVGVPKDLGMWNDIKNALKFQTGLGKSLEGMYEPEASKEELNELSNAFMDFVRENEIKITNDETSILEFINARGELGSNYIFSDYMAAYESGIWKLVKEKYGLDDRYDMFEQGTSKIAEFLPEATTNQSYLAAVEEHQSILKNDIFNMWDVIMGENPYIGIQLKEKYLANAIDAPVQVSGVLADYLLVNDIQKELRDAGYMTDEFMNYMNFINWSLSRSIKYAKGNQEDIDKGVNMLLKNANAILETVEDTSMSSTEEATMKAGLAYAMQDLAEYGSAEYDKLQESTKEAVKGFITSLTGSSPVSMKTALEYSTGKNLSGGGGGGGGKSVRQTKGNRGKQHDKIQLALNRVRDIGVSLPGMKSSLSKTAIPRMTNTHKNIRLALPAFELDDIVIEKGMVSRQTQIRVEKPTDTTKKLKITKKSVSSIKSKRRSPKKIKSFTL